MRFVIGDRVFMIPRFPHDATAYEQPVGPGRRGG
jgi:hypothetical protein